MHLSSRKTLLLFAVSIIACRDTNGPTAITRYFVLTDINGRALPTYFSAASGLTPTIAYGALELDKIGQALLTEQRLQSDGSTSPFYSLYAYTISGNQIAFSLLEPCPINANCVAPPTGTISPSTGRIALELARFGSESIIYNFQPIGLD